MNYEEEYEEEQNWDEPEDIPLGKEPEPAFDDEEHMELPPGYAENLSLLDQVLLGKDQIFVSKVLNLMMRCGIRPNDPVFLLMLAMGELELLLTNSPLLVEQTLLEFSESIEVLFTTYFGDSESATKKRFEAALAEQQAQVARAVTELVQHTRQEQFYGTMGALARTIAPAMLGVFVSIGVGVVGTLQYHRLVMRTLIGNGKLTPSQYSALTWAESEEGKYAKKLTEWNQGYLGKSCREDAKNMGLKLNFGSRKVTEGFCVLFVAPPDKRKYE